MNVLVVGGGGREHTLVWKIRQSPLVSEVFCAPGNGGIARDATCVEIGASDISGLADFARDNGIDLTVVGPELPLTLGIVDEFTRRGLTIFGPDTAAARFEGSKVFTKEFMARHGIPTADFQVCTEAAEAETVIRSGRFGFPLVVKADGLAAGKGVFIARDEAEALDAVRQVMIEKVFDEAGERVVVEQFLPGEELSFMVICDGERVLPLVTSQDHKAALDGDKGPNTGGMGAYSPAVTALGDPERVVMEEIIAPTIAGMKADGITYRGVLYAGLMITEAGPRVLEFNVRFGDPETQVVLPRLDEDLVPFLLGSARGELPATGAKWRSDPAACVVLAAGGYPGSYRKGMPVSGAELFPASADAVLFHAGTRIADGRLVTSGGRVFGVTALAPFLGEAIEKTYKLCDGVVFEGVYRRSDIGWRALERLAKGSR